MGHQRLPRRHPLCSHSRACSTAAPRPQQGPKPASSVCFSVCRRWITKQPWTWIMLSGLILGTDQGSGAEHFVKFLSVHSFQGHYEVSRSLPYPSSRISFAMVWCNDFVSNFDWHGFSWSSWCWHDYWFQRLIFMGGFVTFVLSTCVEA